MHSKREHELHMKKPSVKQCKLWIKTDTSPVRKHFEKELMEFKHPTIISKAGHQQLRAQTGSCAASTSATSDGKHQTGNPQHIRVHSKA